MTLEFALSETNLHAVVDRNRAAVDRAFHLAVLLHGGEVHGLLHDLTLLPGHGLALLLASPNLVSVLINVPVGDTVVLGDGVALRHLLVMLHGVLLLLAVLVGEVLVGHMALLSLGRPDLRGAFRPPDSITLYLCGIFTDPLGLGFAFFLEDSVATLGRCGGVLDHIPEGDVSAEVFFQSSLANEGQGKKTEGTDEKIEGGHD